MSSDLGLTNRRALVTGGTKGVGATFRLSAWPTIRGRADVWACRTGRGSIGATGARTDIPNRCGGIFRIFHAVEQRQHSQ
jgi:hypothetical protein